MRVVYEDHSFAILEDDVGVFIYYDTGLVQAI